MRTRLFAIAAAVTFATSFLASPGLDSGHANATGLTVEVTSAADSELAGAACPDDALCTLREAIALVNAEEGSGERYAITFAPALFSLEQPATIVISGAPLPAVLRNDVTIDASNAGVRIDGSWLEAGLELRGARSVVLGLAVQNVSGRCLNLAGAASTAGGDRFLRQGNRLGNCTIGVSSEGAGNLVMGNLVGFGQAPDAPAPVDVGIAVTGADTIVGDGPGPGYANVIGNAAVAVRLGSLDGSGPSAAGIRVTGNLIGTTDLGTSVPVEMGVEIRQPATGTLVQENSFANIIRSAIVVQPATNGAAVTRNTFASNTFAAIGEMAIDLGGDGFRNPNDSDDSDTGPNEMLNHPVFTLAVQSQLTGSGGPACSAPAGPCVIQVYLAAHMPGGGRDYGAEPIPFGIVNTDVRGSFTVNAPAVSPGQWIIATSTDQAGNTSEFGPSTRIGAGTVACGNVTILPGWNHSGFFGAQPVTLGLAFPDDGSGVSKVSAIYEFIDGTDSFNHWAAGGIEGRTLTTLTTLQAYWFRAIETVTFSGGFTLSVPVPVELKPGWNDFVYVGAAADVRDALSSIEGKYSGVYRFVNNASTARWQKFGNTDTPDWARDFTDMQPCTVYQLFVSEDVTLVPLQP